MKGKVIPALKWFLKSFIWLGIVLLGLDILTKQLVVHSGAEPASQVADWGFVHINYVWRDKRGRFRANRHLFR